jgi:hypothetical protein
VATVRLTDQAMGREILIIKHDRPLVKMRVYIVGGKYYQVVARSALARATRPRWPSSTRSRFCRPRREWGTPRQRLDFQPLRGQ